MKKKLSKNSSILVVNKNLLRLKNRFNFLSFIKKVKKKKHWNIKIVKHNKKFSFNSLNKKVIKRKNSKSLRFHFFKKLQYHTKFLFDYINLYTKFINFIFKSGKKAFWEKVFAKLFFILFRKLKYSRNFILLKIFLRLHTKVEIRKVQSRRRLNLIPFFIKFKRRCFLSLKWLLAGVKKNKANNSLQEKLLLEILLLLKKKTCVSVKLLEENNLLANKNRANIHFRW